MLQFSSRPQPRLLKANFANTDVQSFIEHIHQLIRAEAFDETVMDTAKKLVRLGLKTAAVSRLL
jgi:hypothetical protein